MDGQEFLELLAQGFALRQNGQQLVARPRMMRPY
jgi:hypothetical protein